MRTVTLLDPRFKMPAWLWRLAWRVPFLRIKREAILKLRGNEWWVEVIR